MTTTVTFTLTERKRVHILRELDAKRLTAREAAVTRPPIPVPGSIVPPQLLVDRVQIERLGIKFTVNPFQDVGMFGVRGVPQGLQKVGVAPDAPTSSGGQWPLPFCL